MSRITVRRARGRGKESGYMLLFLMLAVALLTITMLGVARNYRRSIVRDREVEMMHRGDQYARAVKRFYKKNGSYPTSLEQLEKTNNIRYLRKRYKDPMSPEGAWKLAHLTDIKLSPAGGLTSAGTAGALNQPQANAGILGSAAGTSTTQSPGSSNTGAASTSGGTSDTGATTDTTGNPGAATGSTGTSNNAATSGQVLGGGPVIGVVSTQKAEGIHSFGGKKKYNEWFFIYDPTQDKGQLLTGPYNPNTFIGTNNLGVGTTGTPGSGTASAATPGSGVSNPASSPAPSSTTPAAPMSSAPMQ